MLALLPVSWIILASPVLHPPVPPRPPPLPLPPPPDLLSSSNITATPLATPTVTPPARTGGNNGQTINSPAANTSLRRSRRNSGRAIAAAAAQPILDRPSVMIPNAGGVGSDLWTDLHQHQHHGGGMGDHSRDRSLEEASVSPPDFHRHSSSLTSASTGEKIRENNTKNNCKYIFIR